MKTTNYILMFILITCNANLVMGFGIMYNFLTSLFKKNVSTNSYGLGGSSDPSFPTPVPILNAKLKTNVCGPQVSHCPKTRYRSINGSCNNLANPGWGSTKTTYLRVLKNRYSDGIFKLPKSTTGGNLPNPREVSITFFKDKVTNDALLNLNAMQWGQVITHDMSLFQSPSAQIDATVVCCKNGKLTKEAQTNEFCAPVTIPQNDPIHKPGSCLEFVRADTDRHVGCVPESQEASQLSLVTSFLDASIIYGSTDEQAAAVRAFENGNLKTVTRHGREWPPQVQNVTETCSGAESPKEICYLTGDVRANQNTELTVLQILGVHFHNYVADGLSQVNPHWGDETLYQESRRVVSATFQNIHYYEYLPYFLSEELMLANKLIYARNESNMGKHINDYNPKMTPGILAEHATAAWRYLHTLIQGFLALIASNLPFGGASVSSGELRLSDHFNRPKIIEQDNVYDKLVYGMTGQPSSVVDIFFTDEITEYLFRGKKKLGDDLRKDDVQRDRDFGLGSYVEARAACNLSVPKTWDDLRKVPISDDSIKKLKDMYIYVINVDLTVGGSLEPHVPGTKFGPTFLCFVLTQFFITRVTDRYFYENGQDKKIAFTSPQLINIRNFKVASFFCASSEAGHMQRRAFEVISASNPVVSCDEIPSLDFNLWKENSKLDDEEGYECNEDCGEGNEGYEEGNEGYGEGNKCYEEGKEGYKDEKEDIKARAG